ncbi:Frataxin [Mycena albidolilacea]|uniref:ferroxidase n=1 Tax=Mycena albidolilacea TaxID=1033008 RepID=A0AAD7AFP1_9AGAR|nr:Frataxin [Mycena albidolilacea]
MLPSLTRLGAVASVRSLGRAHRPLTRLALHGVQCRRQLSTPPPQLNISELSTERYNNVSDATMDDLLHALENVVESLDNPAYEVEYHSGVLTLLLGDKGTYVINKQPPNKQIWLSSPFSGPKRYDYQEVDGTWVYSRDGQSLSDLLNRELSEALERPVDVTDVAN